MNFSTINLLFISFLIFAAFSAVCFATLMRLQRKLSKRSWALRLTVSDIESTIAKSSSNKNAINFITFLSDLCSDDELLSLAHSCSMHNNKIVNIRPILKSDLRKIYGKDFHLIHLALEATAEACYLVGTNKFLRASNPVGSTIQSFSADSGAARLEKGPAILFQLADVVHCVYETGKNYFQWCVKHVHSPTPDKECIQIEANSLVYSLQSKAGPMYKENWLQTTIATRQSSTTVPFR